MRDMEEQGGRRKEVEIAGALLREWSGMLTKIRGKERRKEEEASSRYKRKVEGEWVVIS
jgi:hypothetical protein